MATERRRYPRAEVLWSVGIITTQQFLTGQIKDISLAGAFICCPESLKPGEAFEMRFTDSPQGSRIEVRAEMVWSNITLPDDESQRSGMGVRFVTISNENRKVISTLISNHLKVD